jgi:IS5 family transposase
MKQISFADAEYAGKRKKTRREVFLEEMERVVRLPGCCRQSALSL